MQTNTQVFTRPRAQLCTLDIIWFSYMAKCAGGVKFLRRSYLNWQGSRTKRTYKLKDVLAILVEQEGDFSRIQNWELKRFVSIIELKLRGVEIFSSTYNYCRHCCNTLMGLISLSISKFLLIINNGIELIELYHAMQLRFHAVQPPRSLLYEAWNHRSKHRSSNDDYSSSARSIHELHTHKENTKVVENGSFDKILGIVF